MSVKHGNEFKQDAVALVNMGITEKWVCADLGISTSALHAWVRDDRSVSGRRVISVIIKDARWPGPARWVKMSQRVNGIRYVGNAHYGM